MLRINATMAKNKKPPKILPVCIRWMSKIPPLPQGTPMYMFVFFARATAELKYIFSVPG